MDGVFKVVFVNYLCNFWQNDDGICKIHILFLLDNFSIWEINYIHTITPKTTKSIDRSKALFLYFNLYIGVYLEEFEDFKGVIRIRISKKNTMAKRKSTKGQTTIYKAYT